MDAQRLFDRIGALYPQYVDFWKEICRMETPTADKGRVDALGEYLCGHARGLGFQVRAHREEKSGDALCFTMNPDAHAAPVCFSAHMDTVYPVGAFGSEIVRADGEYLYGPGVADCKGGIAAGFLAMRALSEIGFTARPVRLIAQSDEEVGSSLSQKRTVAFMRDMAEGCPAFLNLETQSAAHKPLNGAPAGEESAVIVRKGILRYAFRVRGRAAHSARCREGVSAVAEAAHKILELERWKSENGLTCNCSLLRGGSAANAVPDQCTFTADIRFRDAEQMERAMALVAKVAAASHIPGSSCETELLSSRCAMERNSRNEELLARMNQIYRRVGLPVLRAAMSNGGSDAADMSGFGIATVDSIGVTGSAIHSPGERAELKSLAACAKRIAVVAAEL